ncbi:hypothetical protein CERSUDRAFT_98103 [Gelatoporia subvermispora B]|uniref:Uncharacterized protein n=1 Tax=Ceriporiopsis subvermispora (strain B) TaxID=914234 RepID=M2R702_CERS8|nr:hypothetical protein CERSUDRAFT_98103 [Gelatoporia subvermispora B]
MAAHPEKIPILVAGATDSIEGSVLNSFFAHLCSRLFDRGAYHRSEEKGKKVENFKVKSALDGPKDAEKLVETTSQAKVVINSDAIDLEAGTSVLKLKLEEVRREWTPMISASARGPSACPYIVE